MIFTVWLFLLPSSPIVLVLVVVLVLGLLVLAYHARMRRRTRMISIRYGAPERVYDQTRYRIFTIGRPAADRAGARPYHPIGIASSNRHIFVAPPGDCEGDELGSDAYNM